MRGRTGEPGSGGGRRAPDDGMGGTAGLAAPLQFDNVPLGNARRGCLRALATLPALALLGLPSRAQVPAGSGGAGSVPEGLSGRGAAAIDAVLKGRRPIPERVRLSVPKLAENGLSVPLELAVDSPMTAADHVQTVHLIAPANPVPTVARLHFNPRSGAAALRTRIRLADSQTLLAFAEMADGRVFAGEAQVIVTLGGCVDPVL